MGEHDKSSDTPAPEESDADRRRDLNRMKRVATGLLVLATIVFVYARVQEDENPAWGYLRATAEAAMVGALADWFAVTALFRHPLGLPIPHTGIIKERKDQIGDSMGAFVRDNFMTKEVVTDRLKDAHIAHRVGVWLSDPAHARSVGDQSAAAVRGVTEVLSDDSVQAGLENLVETRVRSVPVAPFVGRAMEVGMEGEYHEILLDATFTGLARFMGDNQEVFRRRLYNESPWWVPEQVDDVVFDKIYDVLARFIADLGENPNHPIRVDLETRTKDLSTRLKTSPELEQRGEELKEELLAHPEVRAWSASLWNRIKSGLMEATENPDSELRKRLDGALVDAGEAIQNDPELEARIDAWITDATGYVAEQFRPEVADIIATTVKSWDPDEAADRLELQVGRDLQFIRINGTIVGGLAGLVIYSFSEAFL